MSPADFTIEFYRKCLSQAKWGSNNEQDVESIELLVKVANARGGEFFKAYSQSRWPSLTELCGQQHLPNKHFPVAIKATENPTPNTQTNTTMNTLLNDIYEILIKPLVEAIDRNTAAKTGGSVMTPASTITPCEAPPKEDEDKPETGKRGRKPKAAEAAPATEPEPAPAVEPEVVAPEEPYMSGPELVELMKPLAKTQYSTKLVEFRDNELNWNKPTRELTDPAKLRKMEAKIREFLAANEEDQKDAA